MYKTTPEIRTSPSFNQDTLSCSKGVQNGGIALKLLRHCEHTATGKCSNPMELTNALAMGYVDPALEGQIITFTCPPAWADTQWMYFIRYGISQC